MGFILETIEVFKKGNNMFPCVRVNRFLVFGFFCRGQGREKRGIRKISLINLLIN